MCIDELEDWRKGQKVDLREGSKPEVNAKTKRIAERCKQRIILKRDMDYLLSQFAAILEENQRLAKELEIRRDVLINMRDNLIAEHERCVAAEAKLGKMRHELVKIEHLSKIEEPRKYASALDQIRLLAVAALAE